MHHFCSRIDIAIAIAITSRIDFWVGVVLSDSRTIAISVVAVTNGTVNEVVCICVRGRILYGYRGDPVVGVKRDSPLVVQCDKARASSLPIRYNGKGRRLFAAIMHRYRDLRPNIRHVQEPKNMRVDRNRP